MNEYTYKHAPPSHYELITISLSACLSARAMMHVSEEKKRKKKKRVKITSSKKQEITRVSSHHYL
jgi:hypothetical protein